LTDIHKFEADPFVFKNESLAKYTRNQSKSGSQGSIDFAVIQNGELIANKTV